ncbi:MAG TPA: hypothetical protein VKC54_01430 [Patescibacteria group bacterium]|nr:hypothetical protein [Patescibacteria group bacterium]
MLESLYGKTEEFGQVTKRYKEIRNVLEQFLMNEPPSDEEMFDAVAKTGVLYQGSLFEITVSIPLFRTRLNKIAEVADMTIHVTLEDKNSKIQESQEIPAFRCINTNPKKVSAGTISIPEASDIVKNLEGITRLLTLLKTN